MARGERVLLYAQNSPQFVIAYYGILRAYAVVVPVNPMNRTEELRHYVDDAGAVAAIVGNDLLREVAPLSPLNRNFILPIFSRNRWCKRSTPIALLTRLEL